MRISSFVVVIASVAVIVYGTYKETIPEYQTVMWLNVMLMLFNIFYKKSSEEARKKEQ